ncbi:MAG: DUF5615 family PIN-like protein [bacterium]
MATVNFAIMAGLGIKLYTNENISWRLAEQLRQAGYDVTSSYEMGRNGSPDPDQLDYAASQGRAILSFNVRDFIQLDKEWKYQGKSHAGIIVSTRINDLGLLFNRVKQHLDSVNPAQQYNLLLWLKP